MKNISTKNFVVYIHRDLNNIPIYVGHGAPLRPWSTCDRLPFWKEATKDGYTVEVVFESDDKVEIKDFLNSLIDTIGRKDLHRGTLVNKTNGTLGMHPDFIPKRYKIGERVQKAINQYSEDRELIATWTCAQDITNHLGFGNSTIRNACNRKYLSKGFFWEFASNN